MAITTINNNNVQEYIDKQLIDPYKVRIDLNTSKTANDNTHKWITLADAIKGRYKFNFDYDIKDNSPTIKTLPEVTVIAPKKMYSVGAGEMRPFNSYRQASEYIQQHPKKDASESALNWLLAGTIAAPAAATIGTVGYIGDRLFHDAVQSYNGEDIDKNGMWIYNPGGWITGYGISKAIPTVIKGYNVAKNIYDKGTLWDRYTTLGGRFGYYGNPWQRIWGTVSRNLGLPSAPKHPELLRKIKGFPKVTEEGLLDFNSTRTKLLGEGHSNWTLDRPVVSHNKGNWSGHDLFIVDPVEFRKVIPKENVISIEPSDMFVQNANAHINPKRVTVVSGNPETLVQARQMGMSTLSSPRLRRLYKPQKPNIGKFNFDKGNYGNRPYALEQQRLQQRRGAPTIDDFRLIENWYGLKAGVIPMSEYLQNPLSTAVENMLHNPTQIGTWTYPNNREIQLIPSGNYRDKAIYEQSLVEKAPYRNVFYDPASNVEINSGVTNRVKK